MKEKYFDPVTFMGGWYVPHDICDELIDYYHFLKKWKYLKEGTVGDDKKGIVVKKEEKESFDVSFDKECLSHTTNRYMKILQAVLEKYIEKYPKSAAVSNFQVRSFNIQWYPKKGGFKEWHTENSGQHHSVVRHLVFMTYLNDLKNGGTEFLHQDLKVEAEKGLTLIWPATWTHFHRGVITDVEKYIITGWFDFSNE
tara:strand:+ start:321 stop:911 length:591 start_codon:yes stop_codon:yes gene_type:complete